MSVAGAVSDPDGVCQSIRIGAAGHLLQEVMMNTPIPVEHTAGFRFEALNWVASEALPRDKEQSHRLHEPDHQVSTTDPITGRDIGDLTGHPSVVDGRLTIYFETEASKAAYVNMPVNHPYAELHDHPSEELDRGG
jgi:hypothetical protein